MAVAVLTDIPLPSALASSLDPSGPIGSQRAHDIVNSYSVAFFDRHLQARSAPLIDGPAGQFPDVLFERRP